MKPLEGLKVLDLTRVLAGPFCGMMLADLGADVFKIEAPKGDDARGNGPFKNGESTYFMSLNRGKRSIILDFKNEKHKKVFLDMVAKADVLIENYRPGTMEKLGLGYEDVLKKINPRLIYCAISGFGQTGPYKTRAAYDIIVQAMSGIMSITGQKGGEPTRVGSSIGDIVAGLYGVVSVEAALEARHKTGKGQYIDIGMLDCLVSVLENAVVRYFSTGTSPEPLGNRHPVATPFDAFQTKKGKIVIGIQNNILWEKFCAVIDADELTNHPKFKDNALRTDNVDELKEIIEVKIATKTSDEWMPELLGVGIPCGPINDMEAVINDPQIVSRNMIIELKGHPIAGDMKFAGNPMNFSETKCVVERPSPALGQHTKEILEEFGINESEYN